MVWARLVLVVLVTTIPIGALGCFRGIQPPRPSDIEIARGVVERLAAIDQRAGREDFFGVVVESSRGEVRLSGSVPDALARTVAGSAAHFVAGVTEVVNNLRIADP